MMFSLKKKKKILGGRKRSPGSKTDRMGLSKETKKKIEEKMMRNFIKNARDTGAL